MEKLEDHSPMPYGKYQGEAMEDVPAWYLIWLYDNARASPAVARYVKENMDVLQKEVKESRGQQQKPRLENLAGPNSKND